MELNLIRKIKDNKKGLFKYINIKKKIGDNVGLVLNEVGTLVTEDAEEAGVIESILCFRLYC